MGPLTAMGIVDIEAKSAVGIQSDMFVYFFVYTCFVICLFCVVVVGHNAPIEFSQHHSEHNLATYNWTSFFELSKEDKVVDKTAQKDMMISFTCDSTKQFHNIDATYMMGRGYHGGLWVSCYKTVKDAICEEGIYQDEDLMDYFSRSYPYFNSTTITMNDIRMVQHFKSFDAHKPHFHKRTLTDVKEVKIAFLLLVHHSPKSVFRLLNLLQHPNHVFLIHVDMASDRSVTEALQYYTREMNNVKIVSNVEGQHSGISLVYAEVSAYMDLLRWTTDWDYVINLSESDYTVKSVEEIRTMTYNLNYESSIFYYPHGTIQQERIHPFSVECWGAIIAVNYTKWFYRPIPMDLAYKGSQWHVVHRDFIEFLVNNPKSRELLFFLKNACVPDESYTAVIGNYLTQNYDTYKIKIKNSETHSTAWGKADRGVSCEDMPIWKAKKDYHYFYRKFTTDELYDCADAVRLGQK